MVVWRVLENIVEVTVVISDPVVMNEGKNKKLNKKYLISILCSNTVKDRILRGSEGNIHPCLNVVLHVMRHTHRKLDPT